MDVNTHLTASPPVAIVYVDLDGTLLGANGSVLADHEGRPSLAAVSALVAAHAAGLAVVAVSGRRAAQLAEDVAILGLDGGIAEAGAVRLVGRSSAFNWGECPPDLGPSPRAALESAGALEVVMDGADGPVRPYDPWDAGRVGGHLLHGRLDAAAATARLAAAGIGWAHVIDNGRSGGWPELDGVRAYHLICQGVGKAAAIALDLRERGLDGTAALAIGDSPEDRSMADVVGTYVAVAGGDHRPRANAFQVSGHNGTGVAQAITIALAARPSS